MVGLILLEKMISSSNFAEYASSFLLANSSALFVFVFGATFILLQENYHKYNSTVFFRYIIVKCIPSFTLSLAQLVICFTVRLFTVNKCYYVAICIVSIILSFLTCAILLIKLKRFLDYGYILNILLPNVREKEIISYINGERDGKDNRIEESLRIVLGAINNDVIATEEVFDTLFSWIYNNWSKFNLDKKNNPHNRFLGFLLSIFESVLSCNNYTIQSNMIASLFAIVKEIDFQKLDSFSLLFNYLRGFELRAFDRSIDDSLILSVFELIFQNAPEYIAEIKTDSEYELFRKQVLNSVFVGVRKAIRTESFGILRNLTLFPLLFGRQKKERVIDWNRYYEKLLIDFLSLDIEISLSVTDREVLNPILLDFQQCSWLIMSNTSKSSESTINILLNYAKLLYHNCIDKHIKDVNSFSLDVLFSPLILDEYKEYAREASARCLFSVFDYYLSEKSKSPDAIPYEEYRILFRIDLVIEILEKQDTKSFSLLETIKQNRGQIISSHSSLFSKYEAFKQSGDPFIEIIKEEYL